MLDPKLGDFAMVRNINVRTGYCCINIRRTVAGVVKDNTDLNSWFSAKPIIVGNFNNILAGTGLNLRQNAFHSRLKKSLESALSFVQIGELLKLYQ